MTSEYLEFVEQTSKGKTSVWCVYNKQATVALGEIKWFGAWRKYCFFPANDCIFDSKCLRDIALFLSEQMDTRK